CPHSTRRRGSWRACIRCSPCAIRSTRWSWSTTVRPTTRWHGFRAPSTWSRPTAWFARRSSRSRSAPATSRGKTRTCGCSTRSMGKDMELVVRLHRHFRARGLPYRIEFVADPVCWTEVPEDLGSLSRQRRRWHRGLGQTLWRHRLAVGNPRYGAFGLVALPYFVLFEFFGPVIETLGAALT